MIHSSYRGHPIERDATTKDKWHYVDTLEPTADVERPCGHCHKSTGPDGCDPCLGVLPGVSNAFWGHGLEDEAYVSLEDGTRYAGREALQLMDRLKEIGKP